jgi:hypothetical protein
MFTLLWTFEAKANYDDLKAKAEVSLASRKKKGKTKSSKTEGLFKQVNNTITLLVSNPNLPGRQTHEYHSLPHPYDKDQKVIEAYAQIETAEAYRVFWCYGPEKNQITIIAINLHP